MNNQHGVDQCEYGEYQEISTADYTQVTYYAPSDSETEKGNIPCHPQTLPWQTHSSQLTQLTVAA